MNGYPSTYIELAIRKFLNKKLEPNDSNEPKLEFLQCIKIPYFSIQSVYIRKSLATYVVVR